MMVDSRVVGIFAALQYFLESCSPLILFPAYLALKNGTSARFNFENRSRQDKSGCFCENRTGLDMLSQVLGQPPCRFELSLAEEFFRLVAIMS